MESLNYDNNSIITIITYLWFINDAVSSSDLIAPDDMMTNEQ
jgi:hypothetical protein